MPYLIFETREGGREVPRLRPNVQTAADTSFEGLASSFAFDDTVVLAIFAVAPSGARAGWEIGNIASFPWIEVLTEPGTLDR